MFLSLIYYNVLPVEACFIVDDLLQSIITVFAMMIQSSNKILFVIANLESYLFYIYFYYQIYKL